MGKLKKARKKVSRLSEIPSDGGELFFQTNLKRCFVDRVVMQLRRHRSWASRGGNGKVLLLGEESWLWLVENEIKMASTTAQHQQSALTFCCFSLLFFFIEQLTIKLCFFAIHSPSIHGKLCQGRKSFKFFLSLLVYSSFSQINKLSRLFFSPRHTRWNVHGFSTHEKFSQHQLFTKLFVKFPP